MKKILLVVALLGLFSLSAFGWEKVSDGKIVGFEVTHGQNYGFRVIIEGGGYFYLHESDSNYKAYMAMLMYADAMNYSVRLHSDDVNPPHGLYKLHHVIVTAK